MIPILIVTMKIVILPTTITKTTKPPTIKMVLRSKMKIAITAIQ